MGQCLNVVRQCSQSVALGCLRQHHELKQSQCHCVPQPTAEHALPASASCPTTQSPVLPFSAFVLQPGLVVSAHSAMHGGSHITVPKILICSQVPADASFPLPVHMTIAEATPSGMPDCTFWCWTVNIDSARLCSVQRYQAWCVGFVADAVSQ